MKSALILHGTGDNSEANWFPWLKKQLEERGHTVWLPDLPHAEKPNIQRYNEFLLKNKDFQFEDAILIGHSSGAVAILGLLQDLPEDVVVDTCYLVGSFRNDLGWDALTELFLTPFDFAKIKKHAKKFVFIHSDDDPHCPLDHAKYLAEQVGGELHIFPGEKHFSISTGGEKFRELPQLLAFIDKQN